MHDQEGDNLGTDDATRILVAASSMLIQELVKEINASEFNFDDDLHQALLMKAVLKLNPDAELSEEEKDGIALLNEYFE